jgi:hypothetical protein
MVDNQSAPGEEQEPGGDETALIEVIQRHQGPDWSLAALVGIINGLEKVEIGVTLLVHGQVVSGLAVSGRQFFQAVADATRGAHGVGAGESEAVVRSAMAEMFESFRDVYPTLREEGGDEEGGDEEGGDEEGGDEEGGDEEGPPRKAAYLHLKNAQVFLGGQAPLSNQGVWLRVRLASVDGFAMGHLTVS